jgi:KDO2-lipid IV(A) lauroyltransferase
LGEFIGFLGFYIIKKRKNLVISNIKSALNLNETQAKVIAKKAYINFGKNIAEFLSFPKINEEYVKKYIRIEGEDELKQALQEKKGIINVVGHFGNWELMSVIYRILKYPLVVLVYKQHNKFTNDFINRYRTLHGTKVLFRGISYKAMNEVLREGKMLGIVADQNAGKDGILLEFLGRPASTVKGPVILQRRTEAKLFFSILIRENNHHVLKIFPIEVVKSANLKKDLVENTKQFTNLLEEFIKKYPEQWFWAHKRWEKKE